MKHPIRDRFLVFLCAVCALCDAAYIVALLAGKMTLEPVILLLQQVQADTSIRMKLILGATALVCALFALLLLGVILPAKKKRSSNFAIQQNENGMVRISVKALEALVQRCLNEHPELRVVSSSLFSDEQTVRVDVHITLQSDISMPLAVSALQKQIKRYLEACSGVVVKEVRVFVDGAMPAGEKAKESPYAIPSSLLGLVTEPLPVAEEAEQEAPAQEEVPVMQEETAGEETPVQEEAADAEPVQAPEAEATAETEEN